MLLSNYLETMEYGSSPVRAFQIVGLTFDKEFISDWDLSSGFFISVTFKDIAFEDMSFTGSIFNTCTFINCTMKNCDFFKSDFTLTTWDQSSFLNTRLAKSTILNGSFSNCLFDDSKLGAVLFQNCNFKMSKFKNISNADCVRLVNCKIWTNNTYIEFDESGFVAQCTET